MFDLSMLQTGTLRRVRAKHGDFLVLAGDSNGIGALLAYYGEFCDHEIDLLNALIQPGETVVEVGANIGTHTIPLARRLSPTGNLIAIEAQPVIAMLLQANLALNDIGWVDVRLMAAADAQGKICIPVVDYRTVGNAGAVSLIGADSDGWLQSSTIDSLNVCPSLIKIDVEGMELVVLKGARQTLRRSQPKIYIENNPFPKEQSLSTLRWLRSEGYELYWDVKSLHNPNNFKGQSQPFFSDGFSSNVLALPRDHDVDLRNLRVEVVIEGAEHPLAHLH